jgi:tetratricopeptide (TPR) repeat protein
MLLENVVSALRSLAVGLSALALAATWASAQTAPQSGPPSKSPESERGAPGSDQPKREQSKPGEPGDKAAPKSATPAPGADPRQKGNSQAKAKEKKGPPPIAVQQPRTPAEREKALNDLYALLATADDEAAAKSVSANIERLWLNSGSDTVALLMDRAMQAQQAKKTELAIRLLDAVVDLAPDYAEGWNRRAYVHFSENKVEQAVGDLRRVLALDPNHFKALDGLAHILKDVGQKKAALAAVRKLLEVHPFWEGAKTMAEELTREVEGQAL